MAQKQTTPLLPAYLISGEDELKRETAVKRLRARVGEMGDLAFNFDAFDGESAEGAAIVAACNTLPFASEVRLVLVTRADALKKADSEELVSYLAAPCLSTVLALVAEKLAKNTRLYKAVAALGKTAVIDCTPLKRYQLPKTVRAMATGFGITVTEGAAERLVDLVGENTVRLDAELRKIALAHRGSDPVTEHEIAALVARTSEVKPWELVDAFAARDLAKCTRLLAAMPSASPYALIAQCTARIRELICAKALAARGEGHALAATLKVPDWRVKNHAMWAGRYSSEELRRALSLARDAEQAMKSGTDPMDAFREWMVAVTKPAPRTR